METLFNFWSAAARICTEYCVQISVTFGLLLVAILYLKKQNSRAAQLLSNLPGPPPLPLLGNALDLSGPFEDLLPVLMKWCKIYGPRFVFSGGPKKYVMISCAKDIEKVLTSISQIDKSDDYTHLTEWLGTGLLLSTGTKWQRRRKMLTPAFHFKILEGFYDIFNEQTMTMVNIFQRDLKNDQVIDIYTYIARCTLDIICETAMGIKIDVQNNTNSKYLKATVRMGELFQYRCVRPWLFPKLFWNISPSGREEKLHIKTLHDFTNEVITSRYKEFLENSKLKEVTGGTKRLSFLDLLFEAQKNNENQLTQESIREETDTFMFEGHDTTASAASFVIFLLGNEPKCQAKVHEELDKIFGEDRKRGIKPKDLIEMKYLECCIKESLRLYPSIAFVGRKLNAEFAIDDSTIIPPNTTAFLFLFQLHRDAEVFPNPEQFIPERFSSENSQLRSPYSYVPFSAGPRNCIGQKFAMIEEKILLANIFRNYKVESTQKREELLLLPEIVLRSKTGINVRLISR